MNILGKRGCGLTEKISHREHFSTALLPRVGGEMAIFERLVSASSHITGGCLRSDFSFANALETLLSGCHPLGPWG